MSFLQVGEVLYGSCNGFIRGVTEYVTEYESTRIEAVGIDWIVVRDAAGIVELIYDELHSGEKFHESLRQASSETLKRIKISYDKYHNKLRMKY